jgi:hypothetical protein
VRRDYMSLYEKLNDRKKSGEKLKFDDLSDKEFKQLYIDEKKSDSILAELFDEKKSKITYRRKKLGITMRNILFDELLLGKSVKAKEMNSRVKDHIFNIENLNIIAKAITHFAFRNGPIEDMHADPKKQLLDNDMKILNKFMVNRLAYVFKLIIEERWFEFNLFVIHTDLMYGHDWDEAEPDDGGTIKLMEKMIKDKEFKYVLNRDIIK